MKEGGVGFEVILSLLGIQYVSAIPVYEYKGCYQDNLNRALRYGPQAYGYSIETCHYTCYLLGQNYFALQAGGWCSCDTDWAIATQYGTSINCPANKLGGGFANDLFEIVDTTRPYRYKGCFGDTADRALRYGPQAFGYQAASCYVVCEALGHSYFALQAGHWCSCDNDLNHIMKYGASAACSTMVDGGAWANSVFEIQ